MTPISLELIPWVVWELRYPVGSSGELKNEKRLPARTDGRTNEGSTRAPVSFSKYYM